MKSALRILLLATVTVVLPVWGWGTYFDMSRHGRWFSTGSDSTALLVSVAIGLAGIYSSTHDFRVRYRLLAGLGYALVAGVFLLFLGFASAIANI